MLNYVITVVAIIAWIVYTTDSNIHRSQLNDVILAESHKRETVEAAAAVTPLDPERPDLIITSTTINDAIDRVGLVCCLTTMLFFAAPLSSLVSDMYIYYSRCPH